MQNLASSITVPLPEDLCDVLHYPGKDIRIVRLFRQPVRNYKETMSRGGGGSKDWTLSCKVYVGELGNNANKQEIEDAFKQYGPLKNVWIARNPPGFAFVEFHDNRDAEDAVKALDGTKMCRKYVRVEMSHGKCRWGRGGPPVSQGRYRDDFYRPRQSGSRRSRSPRSRSPPPRRGSRYSRSRSRSRSYSPLYKRSSSPSYRRRDDFYR